MFMANGFESNIAVAPRLAIYSQDGFGLGHMRRTSAIAAQLLGICPAGCALTLSDSPLGQFFPIAANHDYLKLPSIVKEGPGKWRPARLPLSFQVVQEMR
jgi:predicted glycosyltransferase